MIRFNTFNFNRSSGISQLYGSRRTALSSRVLASRRNQTNASAVSSLQNRTAGRVSNRNDLLDASRNLTGARSTFRNLKDSADVLSATGKNSLFEKKDIKQSDGTVVNDYDKDAIYSAVKNFVQDYNSALQASGVVSGVSTDRTVSGIASGMVRNTSYMTKSLGKLGITAASDGKLSVDEEAFKKADMGIAKSLFEGSYSFAGRTAYNAERMQNAADNSIASLTNSLYGRNGGYGGYSGFGAYSGYGNYGSYGGYNSLGNFFNGYF